MSRQQFEYDEIKLNLIKKSLESKGNEVNVPIERRRRKDVRLKFVNFISVSMWAMLLILLAIVSKLEAWYQESLYIAVILTFLCYTICTFSIILNLTRKRRRRDRVKVSLIIYEIIIIAIGAYLVVKF